MRYVEFGDWARNERDGGCTIFREDIEPNKWLFTMKKNELIYCRLRNIER